jgi:hypothetical protein
MFSPPTFLVFPFSSASTAATHVFAAPTWINDYNHLLTKKKFEPVFNNSFSPKVLIPSQG